MRYVDIFVVSSAHPHELRSLSRPLHFSSRQPWSSHTSSNDSCLFRSHPSRAHWHSWIPKLRALQLKPTLHLNGTSSVFTTRLLILTLLYCDSEQQARAESVEALYTNPQGAHVVHGRVVSDNEEEEEEEEAAELEDDEDPDHEYNESDGSGDDNANADNADADENDDDQQDDITATAQYFKSSHSADKPMSVPARKQGVFYMLPSCLCSI